MITGKSIWIAFTQFHSLTRGSFDVQKEVLVVTRKVVIKQVVIYCRYLAM